MTEVILTLNLLKKKLKDFQNCRINFIPTMGNLHFGHESLVRKAIKKSGISIVSIFINPLQFTESQDFKRYPKSLEADLELLTSLGVDYILLPEKFFLKSDLFNTNVSVGNISNLLCGKDRTGHFDGVATIIVKFLNILRPEFIFLGEKDFQQVLVVKKLIKDLSYSTRVITHKIVREKDGLAYSSRNSKISPSNREKANKIYQSLKLIQTEIKKNQFTNSEINIYKKKLIKAGFKKVNYLVIRKEKDLSILGVEPAQCRIFISAMMDGVRLIDNVKLGKLVCKRNVFLSMD